MSNKKRFCLIFLLLIMINFINLISASLGITPAEVSVNFKPNLETSFSFNVETDNPQKGLEVYAKGDLSEYVKFDVDSFTGSRKIVVALKLPSNIVKPGTHRILIGVREKIDKEMAGTIGTSVAVQAPIDVFVPYPGRYLEMDFKAKNANIGEPVKFNLKLMNLGEENLNITPIIEIYSGTEKKETLYFDNRELKSQTEINLQKELNTSGYAPGNYRALAIVDYGDVAKQESEFRIGTLSVDIINYTKQIPIGGINKFEIGVESAWNNKIDNLYAEVLFLNDLGKEFYSFKTAPSDLNPWQKKTIDGFFDTTNFSVGKYNANITLIYYGGEIGKSSGKIVEIDFIKGKLNLPWVIIGISTFVVLAIILLIIFIKKYLMKNAKRK